MYSKFETRAEKFWDKAASQYDKEEEKAKTAKKTAKAETKNRKITDILIKKTIPYLKSTDTVLDVGCGTGTFSIPTATNVCSVDAIDISSNMIALARMRMAKMKTEKTNIAQPHAAQPHVSQYEANQTKANQNNTNPLQAHLPTTEETKTTISNIDNITFVHASMFDSTLKPAHYDVVFCFYIIHLLDDQQKAFKRLKTLLKPNGIIVSVIPCLGETRILKYLFWLLSTVGLIPKINLNKRRDIEQHMAETFDIITSESVPYARHQQYLVARNSPQTSA